MKCSTLYNTKLFICLSLIQPVWFERWKNDDKSAIRFFFVVDLKYRFIEIVSGIKYYILLSDRLRCYHKCTRWYFGNSISFSFYSPNFEMQIGSKPLDTILNFFVANYINFTILDFASRDAFIRQFNWLKPFCFKRWISKNRKKCQPTS